MINWFRKIKLKTQSDNTLEIIGTKEFKENLKKGLRQRYLFPNLDPTDEKKAIDTVVDETYIQILKVFVNEQG